MAKPYQILVINPGSTSTKMALFEENTPVWEETISHAREELKQFSSVWDQLEFRQHAVLDLAIRRGLDFTSLDAAVGRGGLLRPLPGGTYRVTKQMLDDARRGIQGEHASNLGCALADFVAKQAACPAYVVDPISVDEFEPLARYSGHPLLERKSLAHTLNIHAVSRWVAAEMGIPLGESRFVVAHLGGGISVAPVKSGRIVDVNDASSAGPFSPERTGTLPLQGFITLCFSGKYSERQMRRLVMGEGGLVAYLGTHDAQDVEKRIEAGDAAAEEVYEAMAYQIAKEIAAMASVLSGRLDAIILTGGLAHSRRLTDWIEARVRFIAPVKRTPGEFEMKALAEGALRVLRGEEKALDYDKL